MKRVVLFTVVLLLFATCKKDECECTQKVIVCETEYKNASSASFSIIEIKIVGDCLKIKFSASGCDGKTWKVKLIDSGYFWDSDPYERRLKLILENTEKSEALIVKEVSFDIKDLQVCKLAKFILNVSGNKILYEYK